MSDVKVLAMAAMIEEYVRMKKDLLRTEQQIASPLLSAKTTPPCCIEVSIDDMIEQVMEFHIEKHLDRESTKAILEFYDKAKKNGFSKLPEIPRS